MPAPLIGGALASAAAHKLAALGLGASILFGGAVTADAATDGGLHLGVGHETPPGHAVAEAAHEGGPDPESDDHASTQSDDTHGADVRAVAQNADPAAEGEYDNHGEAVSTAARDNHGQETAAAAHAGAGADGHGPPDVAATGQDKAAEHRQNDA